MMVRLGDVISVGDLEFLGRLVQHELDKRQRTLDRARVPVVVYEANERRVRRLGRIKDIIDRAIEASRRPVSSVPTPAR